MLYLVLAFSFILIYVVDKLLMLHFYKKPKHYDQQPLLFLIQTLKFAILLHLIIGSFIYSNNSIFQTSVPPQASNLGSHSIFFLTCHLLIYILLSSGTPILTKLGYLNPIATKEEAQPIEQSNYFNQIFLEYLDKFYKRTTKEISECHTLVDNEDLELDLFNEI